MTDSTNLGFLDKSSSILVHFLKIELPVLHFVVQSLERKSGQIRILRIIKHSPWWNYLVNGYHGGLSDSLGFHRIAGWKVAGDIWQPLHLAFHRVQPWRLWLVSILVGWQMLISSLSIPQPVSQLYGQSIPSSEQCLCLLLGLLDIWMTPDDPWPRPHDQLFDCHDVLAEMVHARLVDFHAGLQCLQEHNKMTQNHLYSRIYCV